MIKNNLIPLLGMVLIFIGCTQYEEVAPFFDGLHLEYKLSKKAKLIYNVKVVDSDEFKIIEIEDRSVLKDKVIEMYVDKFGRVYESSSKDYEGSFTPIWIPVHDMAVGDTFDDDYTVIRRDTWKKWEVLVVKDSVVGAEQYFEINTGFHVGYFGKSGMGPVTISLTNTNADIPTID